MSIALFQTLCVVIVSLTLVTMARSTPWKPLLSDYFALSVAGYLGEESCITLYHFYQYSPAWNARLVDVPLLVPLIWPLVVLSARQVGQALWPDAKSPLARAAITAALVTFDASLMEVVAVRAGLWSWAEPGHLQVPLIGILGWGYFALGAELVLGQPWRARRLWLLLLAPLVTHALIVGSWWICFRHALRGDLGQASVSAMAGLGVLSLVAVLWQRRRGHCIPLAIAGPRMIAATLFVALLLATAPRDPNLWLQTLALALPYLAATSFRPARA